MEFTIAVVVAVAIIGALVIYEIVTHSRGHARHAEEDSRLSVPVQVMDPLANEPLNKDNGEEITIINSKGTISVRVNPRTAVLYRKLGLTPFRQNLDDLAGCRGSYCYYAGDIDLELIDLVSLHHFMFGVVGNGAEPDFDRVFDTLQHAWEMNYYLADADVEDCIEVVEELPPLDNDLVTELDETVESAFADIFIDDVEHLLASERHAATAAVKPSSLEDTWFQDGK